MLYLDASVLLKRYLSEKGSGQIEVRAKSGEPLFTSVLSYAEVHATLARKFRQGELSTEEFLRVREQFEWDWSFSLSVLELELRTMAALPRLVQAYALRAGDAVQLASAIWLRENFQSQLQLMSSSEIFEFAVADRKLAEIALQCGFEIFNPEDET